MSRACFCSLTLGSSRAELPHRCDRMAPRSDRIAPRSDRSAVSNERSPCRPTVPPVGVRRQSALLPSHLDTWLARPRSGRLHKANDVRLGENSQGCLEACTAVCLVCRMRFSTPCRTSTLCSDEKRHIDIVVGFSQACHHTMLSRGSSAQSGKAIPRVFKRQEQEP